MPSSTSLRFMSLSGTVFVARLAGAALGFATQVFLARLLSADGLGRFYLATSIAAVFGIAAASGYPNVAARFVVRYSERARPEFLSAFLRRGRRDTLVLSGLATACVAGLALLYPHANAETRWAIGWGALAVPAVAMIWVNGAYAVAIRRYTVSWFPDLLCRPALFVLALLSLLALGVELSVVRLVLMWSLVAVAVALHQGVWLARYLPDGHRPIGGTRGTKLWRAASRPLLVVSLFTALFADLDLTILGYLLPAAQLAIVGVCLKLSFLVGFSIQLVQHLAAPDIAQGRLRGHGADEAVARANYISVAATLLATLGAIVCGDRVLAVFGTEFAAGQPTLVALLGAQLVRAAFGPSVQLLTVLGGERQSAAVFGLSIAVLGLANVVLVPALGMIGAALTVLLTTLFWTVALAFVLFRHSGARADIFASLAISFTRGARALKPPADRIRPTDTTTGAAPMAPNSRR